MTLENYEFPNKDELIGLRAFNEEDIEGYFESYRHRYGESLEKYAGIPLDELPERAQISMNTFISKIFTQMHQELQKDEDLAQDLRNISYELKGMGVV